jgi:hypothetical protein
MCDRELTARERAERIARRMANETTIGIRLSLLPDLLLEIEQVEMLVAGAAFGGEENGAVVVRDDRDPGDDDRQRLTRK